MKNNEWLCRTCKYNDLECQEQCKQEERTIKEKIERCKDCMGATFLDCEVCYEMQEERRK